MNLKDKEKSSARARLRVRSESQVKSGSKLAKGVAETHYTYILRCADDTLYVGATNNLEKRLVQHNTSKQGAHYTKIRRPVALVYSETFKTLNESRRRESELKRLSRVEKTRLTGKTDLVVNKIPTK